jgi:hypothetical protein
MWGHLKFTYEAPNHTAPNWMAQNQITWRQSKACILKSLCKTCALLRCYAAESDNSILMFWDDLSYPPSRVKKSKRMKTAWLKLTHTIFLFGQHPPSNIFKGAQHFGSQFCLFSGKEHLTWWTPASSYSHILCAIHSNLLRYAPKNKSCPRVVRNRKMAIEKWRYNYKA